MPDIDSPDDGAVQVSETRNGTVGMIVLPGGLLGPTASRTLTDAATELRDQRDVRVVVIEARASSFCLGPAPTLDRFACDPAAAIAALRVPVLCVISGQCRSVGLELALACDIRIASPDAAFAFPDLAAGRLPCWGGSQRLSRAIRPAEATAMLLTGAELSAQRAYGLGLVQDLTDDPTQARDDLIDQLLGTGPLALEAAKEAAHRGSELPLRDGLRLEGDLNHLLAASEDRAEGLQAFFEKRPPDFSGR